MLPIVIVTYAANCATAAVDISLQAKEPSSTMESFERLFDGITFKKGTEVAFATHHKGQLVTQIDGKQV
jgi:hypothetical protein